MKKSLAQIKETFVALMGENHFSYTGRMTYDGNFIYAREWSETSEVAWYGKLNSSLRIEIHESYGIPIIHIYRNGRLDEQRDYSSPKRAINAIREIIRCAGYEF